MAGEHISCTNSRGVAPISQDGDGITLADIERALEAAQAIPVPYNREIVHMIPREYTVDEHNGVKNPLGMHGYRLEVETHIVTAASPALRNLGQCTSNVGINAEEYVLNVLASGEAVLEPNEREMGVIVADIGGGTTDIALYRQGTDLVHQSHACWWLSNHQRHRHRSARALRSGGSGQNSVWRLPSASRLIPTSSFLSSHLAARKSRSAVKTWPMS